MKTVEELAVILKNGKEQERREAVKALGMMNSQEAHEVLLKSLEDESHIVRLFVIDALSNFPPQETLDRLFKLLEGRESDEIVRESAKSTLMRLCIQAPELTIQQLKRSKNKEVRIFLVDIIGAMGTPEAIAALKRMAVDKDPDVRSQALAYLGAFDDEDIADILIENLANSDPMSKIAAIQALGRLKIKKAAPDIIALLDDRGAITFNALLALGEIGDEQAIAPLMNFFRVKHLTLRHAAIDALVKIGSPALPKLLEFLDDDDCDMRILAANAMGTIGDSAATQSLGKAAMDQNPNVRYAALEALDKIGDTKALEYLRAALSDSSRDVVCMAIKGLANMGGKQVVSSLMGRLLESEEEIQYFILDALKQLGARLDQAIYEQFKESTRNEILLELAESMKP